MKTHLPTLLWALLTAVGLLLPGPSIESVVSPPNWLSVTAHVVLFFVMVLLVFRSLCGMGSRRPLLLAGVLSFGYSAALEFAQLGVQGRMMDPFDLVANGVGVLIGALVIWRWLGNVPPRV